MSTIQKGWKSYLTEALKSDPNQSRLKNAAKMHKYLFMPLEFVDPRLAMAMKSAGHLSSNYMFLYDAIFGTKEERKGKKPIFRPQAGLEFANQKVEMLLLRMTEDGTEFE